MVADGCDGRMRCLLANRQSASATLRILLARNLASVQRRVPRRNLHGTILIRLADELTYSFTYSTYHSMLITYSNIYEYIALQVLVCTIIYSTVCIRTRTRRAVTPPVLFLVRSGCVLAAVLAGVGVCAGVWRCSALVRVLFCVCRPVRVRPLPANLRPKIATARKSLRIAHRVRQAARKRS